MLNNREFVKLNLIQKSLRLKGTKTLSENCPPALHRQRLVSLWKVTFLIIAGVIFICNGLKAQDVVINKVYNSSSGNGNSDVIELLVIKDKLDMRGMYLKDAIGAADRTTFGEAGRIMFMDNELWNNLRSGTTIQIGFYTGSDPNNDDLDASDRRIRIYKKNQTTKVGYITDVRTALPENKLSTFEISPYNIIAIKKANSNGSNPGAAAGYVDLVHAFLPYRNTNYQPAYDALTGPDGTTASSKKMAGNSPLPTDGWVYATNPTKSLADYNAFNDGTTVYIAKGSGDPHYGEGEPGNNAEFIAYLRNAPVVESITATSQGTTVNFEVLFSKQVSGVDVSDFSLTATGTAVGNISSITGTGSSYIISVTGVSGIGTLRLDKNANSTQITDGDNPILEGFAFTSGDTFIADNKVAPIVTAGQVFSIIDNSSIGTVAGKVVATLAGEGSIAGWKIISGNETNAFTIDDATGEITVVDNSVFNFDIMPAYTLYVTASNGFRMSEGVAVTVKLVKSGGAPFIESISTTAQPKSGSIDFKVTFSKEVTGVDQSDFSLTTTGTAAGIISSVSGSGAIYTVTVDVQGGQGTIRVDQNMNNTGIIAGNNPILEGFGFFSGDTYTVVEIAPVVSPEQTFFITGSATTGTLVGEALATLNGPGSITDWAIVSGNDGNAFAINSEGIIKVADNSVFKIAEKPTYILYVEAINHTTASEAVPVSITLIQNPSAPVVVRAFKNQIAILMPQLQGKLFEKTTITDFSSYLVTLYMDGVELENQIAVNSSGIWAYKLTAPVSDGQHSFHITYTKDGKISDPSPSVVLLTSETEIAVKPYTIITPNNDGKNDTWKIENLGAYPDNEVIVYGKSGKVVYQQINYQQDWSATSGEGILETGTYYYVIKLGLGNKALRGALTIIKSN